MEINICKSTNPDDYEILIRRRSNNDYASYCPQLNYMIKGAAHESVLNKMKTYIYSHIGNIRNDEAGAAE